MELRTKNESKGRRRVPRASWGVLLLAILSAALPLAGCGEAAEQPPYYQVLELNGTPYERGFQHGEKCANKIRSLYTQLLTSSLLPWLNREQADIESVLVEYKKPEYDDGQFSYQVLLQSGQNLMKFIPEPYLEEMQGVADGAGLPFEQILLLNTFVDTLLGLRSITFLIRELEGPHVLWIEFEGGLASDGLDNDGDGQIDEPGEGHIEPYEPTPWASMVEVPEGARIRMRLRDRQGVDPASIRLQLDDRVIPLDGDEIQVLPVRADATQSEILFTPAGGMAAASTVALLIQAGDLSLITDPPPFHARLMRDERVVFTTRGAGKKTYEVPNRGAKDNRYQPPSVAFAVRGSATTDGRILVGEDFALLDSNSTHKHTVLFVHRPEPGGGKPHIVLGWAGVIWGFSGMNSDGLVFAANSSDTLNNPMAREFLHKLVAAKLLSSGVPVGIAGREMLRTSSTVDEATSYLAAQPKTFGWNYLLADKSRRMRIAEVDSNILDEEDRGFYPYTPEPNDPGSLDPWGRPWASVGPDDLRMGSHYVRNTDDINLEIVGFRLLPPQRFWTSFYFRSLRAFYVLGDQIAAAYGNIDARKAMEILSLEDLVDQRDSMNAAVYDPEALKVHYAMGEEPATDAPFREFDLGAALAGSP